MLFNAEKTRAEAGWSGVEAFGGRRERGGNRGRRVRATLGWTGGPRGYPGLSYGGQAPGIDALLSEVLDDGGQVAFHGTHVVGAPLPTPYCIFFMTPST